jgi:hypothetical protein
MRKHWFPSTVLGGLIAFVWGVLSWIVLPWHSFALERFTNESQVASVIRDNAPADGVYILPNMYEGKIQGTSQEVSEELIGSHEIMQHGPHMFAAIRLHGRNPYTSGGAYIRALFFSFAAAFLITWLVLKTKNQSYMDRVWFVACIALIGGFLYFLPAWNFMCFPLGFAIVGVFDFVIGWFLAGLAISKFCGVGKR